MFTSLSCCINAWITLQNLCMYRRRNRNKISLWLRIINMKQKLLLFWGFKMTIQRKMIVNNETIKDIFSQLGIFLFVGRKYLCRQTSTRALKIKTRCKESIKVFLQRKNVNIWMINQVSNLLKKTTSWSSHWKELIHMLLHHE